VQLIEADVVIFGYGTITKSIIAKLQNRNASIICVTDNEHSQREINSSRDIQFFNRSEIVKSDIKSKNALFSWRNIEPLLQSSGQVREWLMSSQFKAKQSFLLSSASVYADSNVPINESTKNLDLNATSDRKMALEIALSKLMKSKSIFHSNLRISNAYGRDLDYGFIASLRKAIGVQTSVKVFTGREITRDYISINDIAFAIDQILEADFNYPDLNISTGRGQSISQVLTIFSTFGHTFENRIDVSPSLNIKDFSVLDCGLLSSLINWNPKSLTQGIQELLNT